MSVRNGWRGCRKQKRGRRKSGEKKREDRQKWVAEGLAKMDANHREREREVGRERERARENFQPTDMYLITQTNRPNKQLGALSPVGLLPRRPEKQGPPPAAPSLPGA